MYKLIYFNENNEKTYSDKKIAEDDIIKIKNIGKLFFDVLLSLDYYNIVNDNLIEIMENIKKLDLNVPKNFAKINRYFINISNSFYMYQLFYEKQFKNKYKFVFSNIYDNYDNYVLMYNLRNYVVHNTLAITKLTFDINKNIKKFKY